MSILSNSVSITRYRVQGKINAPIIDNVASGLIKHTISEIDNQISDRSVGWTSFDNPFQPNFDGSSFVYGAYFVFALRIDKKNIPPKVLKKHYTLEFTKRMTESGRDYLSKNENTERITIKGDGASLEEAFIALSKGAFVTELNMVYKSAELMWQFTLKGESLNISGLRSSKTDLPETEDDMEGYVLEKIFIYEKALQLLENLYSHFVKLRVSEIWLNKETPLMRKWIRSS